MMPFRDVIALSGARVHNLRSVSVQIPHGRFVVCTGVSGSGKSSLAFDTVFAEGLRRCLETLSPGVKHRLELLPRPDFDSLTGLPPVVAVSQRNAAGGPRGTLATLTEIASFLRLLFARAGTAHCPQCGREVVSQTLDQIVDAIVSLETGRKVMILAPRVRGKKGTHRDLFEAIVREGFVRARVDRELVDAASPPALAKTKSHDVEVVVDRIIVKDGLRQRLLESVALALKQGNATCVITHEENGQWRDRLFSSRHACPDCQISLPELEPRTLNFNSPYGACPECAGLGRTDTGTCPACNGERLGSTGRGVTFGDLTLPMFYRKTVEEAANQIADWEQILSPVAARVIPEIARRLEFLKQVGLDYLTLDRPLDTLSGGELQRARLAGALGSGLVGVLYVLDEPTMGLHPRDTERLLRALFALRDQGNTLLVVEHDVAVMSRAEWLIDLGPGAGREGGLVIAEGTVDDVRQNPNSVTGKYLTGPLESGGKTTRTIDRERMLRLEGGGVRNLQQLSVDLPLGVFTCVTGVSGSGKSSLVVETLVPLVRESLRRRDPRPAVVEVPAARRRGKNAVRPPVSPPPAAPPQVELPGVGRLIGAEVITRLIEVD
ncbi:MAG: excinuclease ABC subunit A, partial [Planctomycetota bacterium]|nr:excinuclease ABC subunit A [Planctomycetota bacterium]